MNFLNHSNLAGKHAFCGASKPQWLGYDEEKLARVWANAQAKTMGTRLHAFAAECIDLKQRLPKSKKTLNMYVNDCINYRMSPEIVLYFSDNFFGTADAISFRGKKLKIFDLKTGTTPAHMEQLLIYNALFCLEYDEEPGSLETELRIYQNNDIIIFEPAMEDVLPIMDKIKHFDEVINELKLEG